MCGVVGYCGALDARAALLDSLDALEYRGYDSAGVALQLPDGEFRIVKAVGPVSELRARLDGDATLREATAGIAHTRWATHGAVNAANAHPHRSFDGKVVIAHNGIVENHAELRRALTARGIVFASETDSEAIAHLIALGCADGESFDAATRRVALELQGLSVIVAMHADEPGVVIGARTGHAGGLVYGESDDASWVVSSMIGMPDRVGEVYTVDHCQSVRLSRSAPARLERLDDGGRVEPTAVPRRTPMGRVDRGSYGHYMLKEIMEQPSSVQGAIHGRVDFAASRVDLPDVRRAWQDGRPIEQVVVAGMGSSYFVAIAVAAMVERYAGIPARPAYAGELSDSAMLIGAGTLVIAISQSGETYDTLQALVAAGERGAKTALLTANLLSAGATLADVALDVGTGLELAVPATKTVTGSMLTGLLLAQQLRSVHGVEATNHAARLTSANGRVVGGSADDAAELTDALAVLPRLMNRALGVDETMRRLAYDGMADASSMIVMGRGELFPIALEGALKLKEVSYIHAEGCSASEMKHGINALIDRATPTIALVQSEPSLRNKMLASISEVKARGGSVLAIACEDSVEHVAIADDVVSVPCAPPAVQPLLMLPALQLLAYHCAVRRGINPDRPRNLAKTVTVA